MALRFQEDEEGDNTKVVIGPCSNCEKIGRNSGVNSLVVTNIKQISPAVRKIRIFCISCLTTNDVKVRAT